MEVIQGDLSTQKVDMIVNTTSKTLQLSDGNVSKSLLAAAGSGLQAECKKRYPNGIKNGEVALTGSCKLLCKKVCHVSMDGWKAYSEEASEQMLRQVVQQCLVHCDQNGCKSIAFPALGTGNLGYPPHITAKVMMQSVKEYLSSIPGSSVEAVTFVLYHKDSQVIQAFDSEKAKPKYSKLEKLTPSGGSDRQEEIFSVKNIWMEIIGPRDDVKHGKAALEEMIKKNVPVRKKQQQKHTGSDSRPKDWFADRQAGSPIKKDVGVKKLPAVMEQIKSKPRPEFDECLKNVKVVLNPKFEKYQSSEKVQEILKRAEVELTQNSGHLILQGSYTKLVQAEQMLMKVLKDPEGNVYEEEMELSKKKPETADSSSENGSETDEEDIDLDEQLEILKSYEVERNTYKTEKKISSVPSESYQILCYFFKENIEEFVKKGVMLGHGQDEIHIHGLIDKNIEEACWFLTKTLEDIGQYMVDEVAFDPTDPNLKLEVDAFLTEINHTFSGVYCFKAESNILRIVAQTQVSQEEVRKLKHRIGVKVGTIKPTGRGDRSLASPKESIKPTTKYQCSQKKKIASKQAPPPRPNLPPGVKTFKTKDGVSVHVYKGDIVKLDLDCLVSAANEHLKHAFGVAKAIAKAAGKQLVDECERYLKHNLPLVVGQCLVTSGGNLKCKHVIHTVGPKWKDYKNKGPQASHMCLDDLWKAVSLCLYRAHDHGCRSIAFPALSSGTSGVPVVLCAQQYARAILDYSRTYGDYQVLTDIHFVTLDEQILKQIVLIFTKVFDGSDVTNDNIRDILEAQKKEKKGGKKKSFVPYYSFQTKKKRHEFNFSPTFQVLIYNWDITEFSKGVIVSSEDQRMSGQGAVAKTIKDKAGPVYQTNLEARVKEAQKTNKQRVFTAGEIVVSGSGSLRCSHVYHVVVPRWYSSYAGTAAEVQFLTDIESCFSNLLQKANQSGIKNLALPLIGTGKQGAPVSKCAKVFYEQVVKFCHQNRDKKSSLGFVHLIVQNEGALHQTFSQFSDLFEMELKDIALSSQSQFYMSLAQGPSRSMSWYYSSDQDSQNDFPDPKGEAADDNADDEVTFLPSKQDGSDGGSKGNEDKGSASDEPEENCAICMDQPTDAIKLHKCGHTFCKDCIDQAFKYKPVCPNCGVTYGTLTGIQPKGTMDVRHDRYTVLPGYEGCGAIEVTYNFFDGIQGDEHPNPGKPYKGAHRVAYLPGNEEGKKVAKMLRVAFDRRLTFTIGRSVTTGQDGVVTWNDIHHKTRIRGGPQAFGYPDPTHLQRIQEELAAKGVTEDDIKS